MKAAIAHDWLVEYAGSERCVEALLREFPQSRLVTSILNARNVPPLLRGAEPSFLQHVPGARSHHEWFLPLMPLTWRARAPIADVDVVISSSHACAKAVRVAPSIPHLCYCHTPMRYAWDFDSEADRFPRATRPLARQAMRWFRRWDRRTAAGVTSFVANSSAVADRIHAFYGREARVIHPPVRTRFFTPADGARGDYFLYVGRLVAYKRVDLLIEAFRELPFRLVVIGDGPLGPALRQRATDNVTFAGFADDEALRAAYREARAFVFPGEEDFGIVMAEAQACGAPVVAFARGGAADIVQEAVTGWVFEEHTVAALKSAIERAATQDLDSAVIRENAERFSEENFRASMREAVEAVVERTTT